MKLHIALAALACLGPACGSEGPPPFSEPQVLGGETVDVDTLNAGQRAYNYYCVACHGVNGDGRGPAAQGLLTPPRDFRLATYKFAAVPEGYLPHDEDLIRVVDEGLAGTVMLPWELPPDMLDQVVQYIKTFSPEGEGWRDPDMELGKRIVADQDPWGESQRDAAIARGREMYHGQATCYSCHPAYADVAEVNRHRATFNMPTLSTLRTNADMPEPKPSTTYTRPLDKDVECSQASDCGEDQSCRYGVCEANVHIIPPDFTVNAVRTGNTPASLYRVIAAGIPGTAMPTWDEALPAKDIWAMAYFVSDLIRLRP